MTKREKFERVTIITLAGLIVHIPFAALFTFASFVIIEGVGVNTDVAIIFLVWVLYFFADDDREITDILRGKSEDE